MQTKQLSKISNLVYY